MKGGQCRHNHLAFKCTAGVGIKQREKHNKKKEKHNYNIELGRGALEDKYWRGQEQRHKEKYVFFCQVMLRNKDNKEKWKS